MKFLLVAAALLGFAGDALAADATCADYIRVKGDEKALFNGFIYGFVVARIAERGDAEVNTATARVKELADKFCLTHQTDRLSTTISSFVKVVMQYRSEANPPPSPWETYRNCEEAALKLTYPRKLNGCTDSSCKALTETWISEAGRAKAECVQKKLG
ncbi:hypothetical protein AB7714_19850 [Tardiphaga sp. 1201_B9_N1_1]|uniref:hypothetical protein n=1 Tax=unclassified Tardiphaga TaxID=2631404 RepID=UPI003F2081AE